MARPSLGERIKITTRIPRKEHERLVEVSVREYKALNDVITDAIREHTTRRLRELRRADRI